MFSTCSRRIDVGFIFGRNFTFEVLIKKMKLSSLETTNQQILNKKNARTMYSKLRNREINAYALLTLYSIFT
jgi:hypothetical protein